LAGTVSLNAIPVNAVAAFGLVMVNVKLVVPFSGMLAAPKALLMVGGATTVRLALEVLPVPPSVEVTCTLLFFTPAVVPCTSTETVQEALAARVPPDKLAEPAAPAPVVEAAPTPPSPTKQIVETPPPAQPEVAKVAPATPPPAQPPSPSTATVEKTKSKHTHGGSKVPATTGPKTGAAQTTTTTTTTTTPVPTGGKGPDVNKDATVDPFK